MKNVSKVLKTLAVTLVLLFSVSLNAECQNGYNEPLTDGVTIVEFTPNAVGTYEFEYSVTGLYPWPLTVKVYWQSDTYPGWQQFEELNTATGRVTLYSGTDDNVRFKVEFCTISSTAIGNWTFS